MTTDEIGPDAPRKWLQAIGEDTDKPDEALRTVLRGPAPAAEDEPLSTSENQQVSSAFLRWMQTHGATGETPAETIRRLLRGPKPLDRSIEAIGPDQEDEP